MRSRIFISYRVEDTEHAVGRLAEDLRERMGQDRVFHDIASIVPGADFVVALHQALSLSAATLVVIGPRWLLVTDENGERRLDRPDDWVLQEVASSLGNEDVRVFPVLVGDARMPTAEQLPAPLQPLLRRQAFHLTSRHWSNDVDELVQHLRVVPGLASGTPAAPQPATPLKIAASTSGPRGWPIGFAVAAATAVALITVWTGAFRARDVDPPRIQPAASATAPSAPRTAAEGGDWSVTPSTKFADTAREYRRMFLATSRDPASMEKVKAFANQVVAGRSQYEAAVTGTRVPWFLLGILHGLEGGFAFDRHLHNGDSLADRTVHVPTGRPLGGSPPFTWETSARDVLAMKHWEDEQDWSFPHLLYLAEGFNGYGYRKRGLPSPYVWAATDVYSKGSYGLDGQFNAALKAQNVGVAAVLKELVARGVIEL